MSERNSKLLRRIVRKKDPDNTVPGLAASVKRTWRGTPKSKKAGIRRLFPIVRNS